MSAAADRPEGHPVDTEERVLAALSREQPDRVPVFIYLNPYVDAWYTDEPSYAPVLAACREHADVIYDWLPPAGLFASAAELPREAREIGGGRTEHVVHTPRGPVTRVTAADWRGGGDVKRWISCEEDALRVLSIPDEAPRPDLTEFLGTREALRGRAVAQLTFSDPICHLGDMTDEATLAMWTIDRRDLLREMLDAVFARTEALVRHCLEGGAGPLYYFNGPEYALPPLMSPADFDEFVVAYDARLFDLVHSYPDAYVITHSHGRVAGFLERFCDTGTDGLNVLEPPPLGDVVLSEAKARVGDRMCLIGNIQYDDLARSPADEVDRLVREAIEQGAPGGGFILSPCAYPYEPALTARASENLVEYLVKGREYGRYPIGG